RAGVDPDLLAVVPHGVEVPPVGPVGPVGPARAPALVWAGRLVTAKRPGALLDAVERVSGLGPVVIAGEGPERDLLLRRVAATGWRGPGGVEVVGQLPDLAPTLAAADVYVSTSAAENQPLAMLQAMAHGLPVVATAVGGVPEVVRDGVEGLLVPVDDPDALGAALRRLRDDPRLRRRLGTAARERVAAGWTRSHCVAGLLRTYGRVTA
ncbi:glycosyltransferase family 4 protein, partial [Nocardioides kribbensis]|uniref:glycosyltransferase family 4 protein n=1 Tax=Nocardioides kribbensis TaxID=305517 RepID=UPI0032DBBBC2